MCMDMDMEMHDTPNGNTNGHFMDGNMNGHAAHGELTGLNTHHYNGFGNNNSHVQNGNFPSQPKMNGFSQLGVNGGQKDVLLSQDVLLNLVPIAGRKRGREEIDDGSQEEWKRVRRLETGGGDFGCQGQSLSVLTPPTSIQALSSEYDMMDSMGAVPEQPTFVTPAAEINSKQGVTNHAMSLPIVVDTHRSMGGYQFYCSHKYKNSPCI